MYLLQIKSLLYLLNTLLGITSGRCPTPWWPTHQGCSGGKSLATARDLNSILPAPEADVFLGLGTIYLSRYLDQRSAFSVF